MMRARMLALAAMLVAVLLVPAAPASAESPVAKIIRKANIYREHRGVAPLRVSRSLSRSSSRYAGRMMRSGYFGHSGRIQASRRFRRLGEIIAMHRGYRTRVHLAFRAWARSGSHRAVLLDPRFRWVGAGYQKGRFRGRRTTMWVMQFGRR